MMNRMIVLSAATAVALAVPHRSPAADAPVAQIANQGSAPAAGLPVYKPPKRGAPVRTVGGGTRGADGRVPVVAALAPEQTAQTAAEQPVLYWYLGEVPAQKIEFTLVDPRQAKPIAEATLQPTAAGVQSVRLSDRGVRLDADVAYAWYVAVILDPEQRSKDVITGAGIERVAAPPDLAQRLASAGPGGRAAVYADAGLWYEAIASVQDAIASAPSDPAPGQQRAALLEQVGLGGVVGDETGAAAKLSGSSR